MKLVTNGNSTSSLTGVELTSAGRGLSLPSSVVVFYVESKKGCYPLLKEELLIETRSRYPSLKDF
jgi:hypothetical protein